MQRDALTEAGREHIYTEQLSGAVADRPELAAALQFARKGDTLIIRKLDWLARSVKQLIETVEKRRSRGIGFRSLTEAIDTTTAQGRLVFHMFSALAEFELSPIRERTQAGLGAARHIGRTGGRPPKLTAEDIEVAKAMLTNPDTGVTQIAHRLAVSPATLYRPYSGSTGEQHQHTPLTDAPPLLFLNSVPFRAISRRRSQAQADRHVAARHPQSESWRGQCRNAPAVPQRRGA